MQLKRIFLLGAAALASVAALVAIVAVLNGDFGDTEGKIFATLAATFVAGSTAIAGVALLARGASRPLGYVGVFLAVGGYALWAEQIFDRYAAAGDAPGERLLGTVGGAAVFAVRGRPRTVQVGQAPISLRDDEGIVVRPGA